MQTKVDWIALQRLKKLGFIEERGTYLAITKRVGVRLESGRLVLEATLPE